MDRYKNTPMPARGAASRCARLIGRLLPAALAAACLGLPAAAGADAGRHASAHSARRPARAAAPTISPLPGTPDASPQTQISILGVARRQILAVGVTGSVSGIHAGRLRAYSDGRGASFVLRNPLTQGERVKVRVTLRGQRAVRSDFTVARLAPTPPIIDTLVEQPDKLDHFVSQPSLLAPRIQIRRHSRIGGGDIFLTPLPSPIVHPESNNELSIKPVGPGGPMIINGRGRLVWFDQLPSPLVATNFRPQRFDGHEVLTWWQGKVTATAYGLGEGVIADTRYRTIRTVHAGNGYQSDLHEFVLTPGGDALFTVDQPVLVHVPGTPAGTQTRLLDSMIQEIDVRTGLVMWEWHSLGHIPLADSYATPSNSVSDDAFHLNSIQQLAHDRLLVSARDTSAVYELNRRTGAIVWTLGGKASSFRLGRRARFYFQHDAQLIGPDRVSLFDDGAGPPIRERNSRGLVLALHQRRHVATVARQFRRPGATSAESEGNVQSLSRGKVFVGFGATPFFSEFSATGRLLFDGSLPVDDGSYRTYRFPWHAGPAAPPRALVRRTSSSQVTVYATWNGATSVCRWQVLAGTASGPLRPVATAPDRGFETRIAVTSSAGSFQLRALGAKGQVLGRSARLSAS